LSNKCQAIFLKKKKKTEKITIFFTGKAENGTMAKKDIGTVQKGVRFPQWMSDAIQEIAKKNGLTFTDVVHELLRQELKVMGYSMGIGREASEIPATPQKQASGK
jgi:hypothetical protein